MAQPSVLPALAPAGAYRRTWKEGDRVLLTAAARWPCLAGEGAGIRRIDRYYDALAARWQKRWEGPLLDRARAEGPARPWRAQLDFTVTLLREDLLSLRLDAVEETGGRPRRVRMGDVWQLPSGTPLTLRECLPPARWWRGPVLEQVRLQIGQRLRQGESVFYEDWPKLVSLHLSPDRFYLTQDGPVVFYPPETIAPAMEGFPTFSLAALAPGPAL